MTQFSTRYGFYWKKDSVLKSYQKRLFTINIQETDGKGIRLINLSSEEIKVSGQDVKQKEIYAASQSCYTCDKTRSLATENQFEMLQLLFKLFAAQHDGLISGSDQKFPVGHLQRDTPFLQPLAGLERVFQTHHLLVSTPCLQHPAWPSEDSQGAESLSSPEIH